MDERDSCQYLGLPSGGLFSYRKIAGGEIIFAESHDAVDSFITGALHRCPPFVVLDNHRPIMISARPSGISSVQLYGRLPHSSMEDGDQYAVVQISDVEWLLENRFISPDKIRFDEGLAEFSRFWKIIQDQMGISLFGKNVWRGGPE